MKKNLFQMAAHNSIDEIEEYIESLKQKAKKLSGSNKLELIVTIDSLEAERDKLIESYNELSNATEETFNSSVGIFKTLNYKLKKSIDAIFNY